MCAYWLIGMHVRFASFSEYLYQQAVETYLPSLFGLVDAASSLPDDVTQKRLCMWFYGVAAVDSIVSNSLSCRPQVASALHYSSLPYTHNRGELDFVHQQRV